MLREEGPSVVDLVHRLAECPDEFLWEPMIGETGMIQTRAVVWDVLRRLGEGQATGEEGVRQVRNPRNRWRLMQVGCWILADEWFQGRTKLAEPAWRWLSGASLEEVATVVDASRFVIDPERREELVRRCLSALGLRPEGESEARAQDRLTALDCVERRRVTMEAKAAEERARKVREAMARKEAAEAAAKASRE